MNLPATPLETLPLYQLAMLIRQDWVDKNNRSNINYAAQPYVMAMETLQTIEDNYFLDNGRDIVARFLCNANSWRGEVARAVKTELKNRLKKA